MTQERPPANRNSSYTQDHRPANPSGLRQSYTVSSPLRSTATNGDGQNREYPGSESSQCAEHDHAVDVNEDPQASHATETTSLLATVLSDDPVHPGPCNHGTFSPRPASPSASLLSAGGDRPSSPDSDSSMPPLGSIISDMISKGDWRNRLAKRMKSKTMSNSSVLAQQAGFKDTRVMSVLLLQLPQKLPVLYVLLTFNCSLSL
jgi:hypothetical protein